MLRLNTIYPAFMGECNVHGIGVPCTFVRLAGCNLRCYEKTKGVLCDTPEALSPFSGKQVSEDYILKEVREYGRKVICLTGGEPLRQDVTKLLTLLSNEGYFVVVETNGSKSIAPYRHIRNVSFVVDVKTTSTGEAEHMDETNYSLLDENDFVKFVVDTEEDYNDFHSWVSCHDYLKCKIAVGLFWGSEITYAWLFNNITHFASRLPIYLNMQTHKMICLYDSYSKEEFGKLFIPKEL